MKKQFLSIKIPIFVAVVILLVDYIDFDNSVYQYLLPLLGYPKKAYYDLSFWSMFGAIGSILAATMAWIANNAIKKQLEIEQEPFIILEKNIDLGEKNIALSLKNIGRGVATFITVSFDSNNPQPLFEKDQPNSINLGSNMASQSWTINEINLKRALCKQLGKSLSIEKLSNMSYEKIAKFCPTPDYQFEMFISTNPYPPMVESVFVVKLALVYSKNRSKPGIGSEFEKIFLLKIMEISKQK